MLIYLFYFKQPGFDTFRLYAYTNEKKLAEEFVKQRDMSKFKCVKEKMKKDEFLLLESKYTTLKLIYGNFYTKDEKNFGQKKKVQVLCTFYEEEFVCKSIDHVWEEWQKILFDTRMFNDEYLQAWGKLLYLQFYGFYKIKYVEYADSWYQPYYSNYGPVEGLIADEMGSKYEYDELNLFLKFFHHTFKNDD